MALPRMRTAAGALAEIKDADPKTCITECAIRRAMKRGDIRTVPVGNKLLADLEDIIRYFATGEKPAGSVV